MKKSLLGISTLTLVGLYCLLSVIVLTVCILVNIPIVYGLITSIIIIVIQFLISPFITDIIIRHFYKSDFNAEIPAYLTDFIKSVCEKENMKFPKIGIIDDGGPNAFTYGRRKNDARIVLTRGIFELLNQDEVCAVVAHELGHVVHYDMLFMTFAQLVPQVLYLIYELCKNSSDDDSKSKAAYISIIAYVLYIISQYIILWLSRTREYYADEYSIQTTKKPNSLASALVKIGFGLNTQSEDSKRSTKNLGALGIFDSKTSKSLIVSTNNNVDDKESIKNAMKWEMWNPWAFIYQLESTHPLISKRLINISSYSKEYNEEPYIAFDLEKPESYADDFIIELLIKYIPVLLLILVFIAYCGFESNILGALLGLIWVGSLVVRFKRRHKNNYVKTNIRNLLGEVKVSDVTSIPCELEGSVVGKGDPGYIFSEDFILKDETGIIFLDYNQPLFILNKIFAIFKSHKYIDKTIKIKGWYRRSPVPYVEIYTMEIDGKTKKVYTYGVSIALYIILSILFILSMFL